MKIALDLDGVLADLNGAMVEYTAYEPEDFEQWDKPEYDVFRREAERVWTEHWNNIRPMEANLEQTVELLTADHTVDIVTNTVGEERYVKAWLQRQGITYNRFVHTEMMDGIDKPDLNYDMYIDDKPAMAGQVDVLYIPDRKWNQTIRGDGHYLYHSYEPSYINSEGLPSHTFNDGVPDVVRVTGLLDVIHDLSNK
jgi:hypothetical protein